MFISLPHYLGLISKVEQREVPMKINAAMVSELRKQHSWSQDELATAAALNVRTVQRIENDGTASQQSAKAIASALNSQLEKLKLVPEKRMQTFEYKSVMLNFRAGIFKQGLPETYKRR
jgi:transcriptional regulator with XRE-family HTH domain